MRGGSSTSSRSRARVAGIAGLAAALLAALAAVAVVLLSGATLTADAGGFAQVDVGALGGTLLSAVATDAHGHEIPIRVHDGQLTPAVHVAPGTTLAVVATVKRPGWDGWALGARVRKRLTLRAPAAPLRTRWTTLPAGRHLRVSFAAPVARIAYGSAGHLRHVELRSPRRTVDLGPQAATSGTLLVSAAAERWERLPAAKPVTWFPAGRATAVVAPAPAPGATLTPTQPLTVTYSTPLAKLADGGRPSFAAAVPGAWHRRDSHTLVFTPSGAGYGLGAHVELRLPTGTSASWTVPPGSTLRLHQLLAQLGYLPLSWTSDGAAVANDAGAQLDAAVDPPHGSFDWNWRLPGQLTAQWNPDATSELTRGALMAFENDHGLAVDALAGPQVWSALFAALARHERNRNGYSYVLVHRDAAQQTATLIHDGRTIISTPGNTGVPAAPTELGTFPVYLRYAETTMSGTNPDGSRYVDPGIKWVSYFNGGDALHAFDRASYGTPQSVGCVELPEAAAAKIWPYTPIGTLVTIAP